MRWLLVLSLCACGSNHAEPSVAQAAPVAATKLPLGPPLATPGERMSYRISLGDMELASYDLAIGDVTQVAGKQAIVVQTHAKALGLVKVVANIDDYFTSWIDVTTGRPLLWTVDEFAVKSEDKEKTEARMSERTGDTLPLLFHLNNEEPKPEPQKVSMEDVWDKNSFLIALRGWESPPGSTVNIEVLRSRFLWNVKMKVRGRDKLVTELGDFPALRFDGHAFKVDRDGKKIAADDERDFSIWISDDADRVPLQLVARTDYGDIKMRIVEYQPGSAQARARPK